MAGYVLDEKSNSVCFHMGDDVRVIMDIKSIVFVQLDGDELEHIIRCFDGVPVNLKMRVNKWRGDIAKFIIENW